MTLTFFILYYTSGLKITNLQTKFTKFETKIIITITITTLAGCSQVVVMFENYEPLLNFSTHALSRHLRIIITIMSTPFPPLSVCPKTGVFLHFFKDRLCQTSIQSKIEIRRRQTRS